MPTCDETTPHAGHKVWTWDTKYVCNGVREPAWCGTAALDAAIAADIAEGFAEDLEADRAES